MKEMKTTSILMAVAIMWSMQAASKSAEDRWTVNRMTHDEKNLYLATAGHGLVVIDKLSGVQTFYNVENGLLTHDNLFDVAVLGDVVAVSAGVESQGDGKYSFIAQQWAELIDLKSKSTLPILLSEDDYVAMTTLYEDNPGNEYPTMPINGFCPRVFFNTDGCLWLSVSDCRAACYNLEQRSFTYLTPILTNQQVMSYPKYAISDFATGNDGSLWIAASSFQDKDGNISGPLYQLSERLDVGYDCRSYKWDEEQACATRCMTKDHDGRLWIGTEEGQVYLFDETGSFVPLLEEGQCSQVVDIEADVSNHIWMISPDKLFQYNEGSLISVPLPSGTGRLKSLDVDGSAVYIVAENGLYKYDCGMFNDIKVPANEDTGISFSEETGGADVYPQLFSPDGKRCAHASKGVSIIRYNNMTTRKLVSK